MIFHCICVPRLYPFIRQWQFMGDSYRFPLSALRSLLPEAQEGVYSLEVQAGGQVVGSPHPGPQDSRTFKVGSKEGGKCVYLI